MNDIPPVVTPPATPPAPATPPVPPPEAKPPPVDVLGEIRKRFAPQPRAKTPETKVEPEVKPPEVKPPEAKVEPKAPEPKPKEEEPPRRKRHIVVDKPDTKEIVKDVVTQVVKEINQPKPEPKAKESPIPEMFREHQAVYETLEKINPEKYGNNKLVKKLADSARKIEGYQVQWERDNPGQEFDPEQHQEQIEALTPDIPQDDLIDARVELRLDRERQSQATKEREKTNQTQQEEHQRTTAQIKQQAQREFGLGMMFTVDPELEKLHQAGDTAKFDQRFKQQSALHSIGQSITRKFEPMYSRAAVLFSPTGQKEFDKESPLDRELTTNVIDEMEKFLDGQDDGQGRTYVPHNEYLQMSPKEQSRSFTFSRELALGWIKRQSIIEFNEIKKSIEEQFGTPKTKTENPDAQSNGRPPVDQKVENPPPSNISAASGVGVSAGGPKISTDSPTPDPRLEMRNKFLSRVLGRKMAA